VELLRGTDHPAGGVDQPDLVPLPPQLELDDARDVGLVLDDEDPAQ
jgi:hypothetical protein